MGQKEKKMYTTMATPPSLYLIALSLLRISDRQFGPTHLYTLLSESLSLYPTVATRFAYLTVQSAQDNNFYSSHNRTCKICAKRKGGVSPLIIICPIDLQLHFYIYISILIHHIDPTFYQIR